MVRVNFSGVVGVPVYVSSSCSFVVSWLLRVRLCFSGGRGLLCFFVVCWICKVYLQVLSSR